MKNKTFVFNITLFIVLFVFPIWGQTSVVKINVINPPTNLPLCKTRIKTAVSNGTATTIFSVLIPRSLELDVDGSTVSYKTESNNYVFVFEGDAGTCETKATWYEITLSGPGQINSGSNSAPTVVTSVATSPAPTELEAKEENKAETKAKEVDFSIPESPGFTILGLTPQEVTRPATPREFATAIINSIDRNGNLQSGIAIDTAPYQSFFGKSVNRDRDYIDFQDDKKPEEKNREPLKHYLTRFLWRTQFSLATTKGTTDADKSARIGAGLNFTFFDFGDPNTDFLLRACNDGVNDELDDQALKDIGVNRRADLTQALQPLFEARKRFLITQGFMIKKYEACVDDSEKRNMGKSSFGVGLAGSWISKNGESSKFNNNGQGLWASLAYGFEGIPGLRCTEDEIKDETSRCIAPQLIFHFRRRVKETVPDPLLAGVFTTKDSNLFGVRLRLGVPRWSVNFEGVYRGERFAGKKSSSNFEMTIGADYKLATNLYLNFSIGGETKDKSNTTGGSKVFVRTSFNWGTSQKPIN